MKDTMHIGIMGFGFVGQAVAKSYLPADGSVEVTVYDPNFDATCRAQTLGFATVGDWTDMGRKDAIFVCVPTPEKKDGSCDDQYLRQAVEAALELTPTVICKSTAPVSVYKQFDPALVAFVPEFLRAATADEDYMTQEHLIIGSDERSLTERVYQALWASQLSVSRDNVHTMSRASAIMGKYTHNVALAVKVAVMNEMYDLAVEVGADWSDVRDCLLGTNAGTSHTHVPGPDGQRGFGGACFPKDLNAMRHLQADLCTFDPFQTSLFSAASRWIQPKGGA